MNFYLYVILPLLTVIQVVSNVWVNKAQKSRLEALNSNLTSLREYEKDLRSQLTDVRAQLADQKSMMEMFTQGVPLLKTTYEAVSDNQTKLLSQAEQALEKANREIEEREKQRLASVDNVPMDQKMSNLFKTLFEDMANLNKAAAATNSIMQFYRGTTLLPAWVMLDILGYLKSTGLPPEPLDDNQVTPLIDFIVAKYPEYRFTHEADIEVFKSTIKYFLHTNRILTDVAERGLEFFGR
ncbi:hypothetical protein HHL22_10625 [Hymenobacter sp. RP-2-7]|uniref:Uncharacterized protein n=1 Tax=Hymenobacter polaris TaxID=2682546 RepID=A0A7Y0AE38_9BACT|nr:hypothetical protein [Hymenobacter polaris]NML65659.1 hypothetical protein [Hymenobacter polaris]